MQSIHFIGIGGTAMAGAAFLARERGLVVRGSDQNLYPPTVDELRAGKIPFTEGYAAENLAYQPDLVVLGNAISRGNPELEEALDRRLRILSLPEFIAEYVIGSRPSYVIAGTHGKTTTTALIAHVLRHNGIDAGFMVGGVAENFERSATIGSDAFVIEGDEYDTSIFDPRSKFLLYRPTHVIINNIEFDHADIFADLAAVEATFARLVKIIPRNGLLVTNADNPSCMKLAAQAKTRVVTFGEGSSADLRLTGVSHGDKTEIRFLNRGHELTLSSPLRGKHNALNTLAAYALLEHRELLQDGWQRGLDTFQGVKRRLQVRLENTAVTVLEDFAHHPTAIRANLETLRELYPGRRLVVLIEPRSNTMVRNFFQQKLVEALATADVVFSDAIYRAEKYAEAERLDLNRLKADLEAKNKEVWLLPAQDRAVFVTEKLRPKDLVCFMTNGSFSGLIGEVVAALSRH
ncbi:MAG: hypothetical protein J0L53_15485 [Spirochaetes bacterium]|nr:hypothetical protein [Spirochaetota bacterium]